MTYEWRPGQRAVINRRDVVIIDRVTPSGRAVIGMRTFQRNGYERGNSSGWKTQKLEPLTPEIEAEMALVHRGRKAYFASIEAIGRAEKWTRSTFNSYRDAVPELADIEKTERLVAAINAVLEREP